ncbi:MAG: hypothetical protein Q4G42_01625 [Neisseria sp.]|nr:hypothetical protein [Neisseria sp.]
MRRSYRWVLPLLLSLLLAGCGALSGKPVQAAFDQWGEHDSNLVDKAGNVTGYRWTYYGTPYQYCNYGGGQAWCRNMIRECRREISFDQNQIITYSTYRCKEKAYTGQY